MLRNQHIEFYTEIYDGNECRDGKVPCDHLSIIDSDTVGATDSITLCTGCIYSVDFYMYLYGFMMPLGS